MRELLLLLCRYPFDEANRSVLSRLLGEVQDWHQLVELINAHGIIALAAYNIKEARLEKDIPEDAMAILENGHMQSVIRNTWLTERWKEVNSILTGAGIKHVLLKGMALEHTLYGSRGLRQMNDNDILVKREDSLKAWYLLQQKGFFPALCKSPLHKKIMADIGKHLPCLYKNGYAVEIHHKLYEPLIEDKKCFDTPVDDAVEILISGTKAWVLSEKHQLRHLINHFEKHTLGGDQQLRLYADIMLLDKSVKIEIADNFLLNPQQNNKFKYRKSAYKAGFYSIPVKHRLRFLLGDIFPSVKWMKKRYNCNGRKAFLYYPVRMGKLGWLF